MNKCSGTLSMERPGPSCLARARSQLKAVSLITGEFCSEGPPGLRAQCGRASTTRKYESPPFPHQCVKGRGVPTHVFLNKAREAWPPTYLPKGSSSRFACIPWEACIYFPALRAHVNTFLIYFTKS